jgi:rhodanese-related sulfurtransferase
MNRLRELTPAQVQARLAAGKAILVDVREQDEHAAERISGAYHAPLSSFDPSQLPRSAGKEVILHCAGGKRSATAVARCLAAGIPVDTHLAGGLAAWKAAGLPVESRSRRRKLTTNVFP